MPEEMAITMGDVGKLDLGPRYTCKGPRWNLERVAAHLEKLRTELGVAKARLAKLEESEVIPMSTAVALQGRIAEIERDLAKSVWELDLRDNCGTDVTSLVLRVPEDGIERDVQCPQCGLSIAVKRTPPR